MPAAYRPRSRENDRSEQALNIGRSRKPNLGICSVRTDNLTHPPLLLDSYCPWPIMKLVWRLRHRDLDYF